MVLGLSHGPGPAKPQPLFPPQPRFRAGVCWSVQKAAPLFLKTAMARKGTSCYSKLHGFGRFLPVPLFPVEVEANGSCGDNPFCF